MLIILQYSWIGQKQVSETHSSILAWEIPWTEEPDGLQSMELQRVRHNWSDFAHATVY